MKRRIIAKIGLLMLAALSLSTSAWAKTVTLSWDASPSAVSGYKVYYDAGSSTPLDGTGATEGDSPREVGNVLTYVIHGLPDGTDHYFAVTAYDSSGNESTYSNTVHSPAVTVPNNSPVFTSIGNKSILEGATLSFDISATDPDGDSLTYSIGNLPAGAGFNVSSGSFSWSPNFEQSGSYSVTFTVSDGNNSDSETIVVTVTDINQTPVLNSIGAKAIGEGSQLTFTVSGSDPDNNALTYGVSGLPSGASFTPSTGIFSWIPTMNQAGNHSVTFAVSDGHANDSETIVIAVGEVNQPPVLNPVGTKTIGEGAQLTFTISGTDPDNDALSYSAATLPAGATFSPTTRSFSWAPEFQISENTRVYPVTFKVSDGADEDSETVTINVTNVNRAPLLEAIGAKHLTEGDIYNLIINATDPDNNQIIYTSTDLPDNAVFTASTRSFSWIPSHDQAGVYSVTFRASDGSLSDSETVTFTVNNGNEAPILDAIGDQSVVENSQLVFVVSASDINDDSLTYSASGLPTGAVFDAEQQRFSWTPDFTQAGNFTALITVTDGLFSDSETVEITVTNSNRPPVISGSPGSSVMATTNYSFAPVASDPDGDTLTFSIVNKPSWATFNSTSGELSGTPTESHVGANSAIVISVSDSLGSVTLAPFSVDVIAYVHQDSDGDGFLDHLDAFPNDNSEWEDTDGDRIGNNSDLDDDNDGIADVRDGSPLDGTQSGWLITATASVGGYLTPEGETSVLYGGSQDYQLTPMAGYYINDLLVDNVSVGLVAAYEFDNIGNHHSISAIFAPIPTGLSNDPIAPGLIGIERVDSGDDSTNLVDSKPKQDLDYRFRVVLRDSVTVDQCKVYLILDNYKYEMQMDGGVLANGADYIFKTRLGAAFSHKFYFSTEDVSGNQVWRYPHSGDLPGPTVELLNGKNVVGIAARIDAHALNAIEAFGDAQVYRWIPDSGVSGQYLLIDSGAPVASGEGYILKRGSDLSLADLSIYGEITDQEHEFQITSGWNLIGNPYGGNVALADIEIRLGDAAPVTWSNAATNNLVVDGIYSYLGADWGNSNEFASTMGADPAILVPWVGYWIYVNPTDQNISLIISKPLQ